MVANTGRRAQISASFCIGRSQWLLLKPDGRAVKQLMSTADDHPILRFQSGIYAAHAAVLLAEAYDPGTGNVSIHNEHNGRTFAHSGNYRRGRNGKRSF